MFIAPYMMAPALPMLEMLRHAGSQSLAFPHKVLIIGVSRIDGRSFGNNFQALILHAMQSATFRNAHKRIDVYAMIHLQHLSGLIDVAAIIRSSVQRMPSFR